MKAVIKSLICNLVSKLPPGGRQAVFERLRDMNGPDTVFREMANARHIVDVSVRGEYGVFRQSLLDTGIFTAYMKTGRWAEETNQMLCQFFADRGGGTYIDVGANIGLTTVPVAQNPSVRCIALEPEPRNFAYLSENVRMNCHSGNVRLEPVAAFSRRDVVRFEISQSHLGAHHIRLQDLAEGVEESAGESVEVQAFPLDELVVLEPGVLAVKLDTEGGEPFVVAGARKTLSNADLVLLEFWPYGMQRMGGDPEEVVQLVGSGFESISFTERESADSRVFDSPQEAMAVLRETARTQKADASYYLNLVMTRHAPRRP